MTETAQVCLYCLRSSHEVPLIKLESAGKSYYICPEHLPVLLHNPQKMAGKLPGVENLSGHTH